MIPSKKRHLEQSPVFTNDSLTKKIALSTQSPKGVTKLLFKTPVELVAESTNDATKNEPTETMASQRSMDEETNGAKESNPLRGRQAMANEGVPLFPSNVPLAIDLPRYESANLFGRSTNGAACDKAEKLQKVLVGRAIITDQSVNTFPDGITQTSSYSSYVDRNSPGTYAASETVVVTVGPEPKRFYIHKDLLLGETRNISEKIKKPTSGHGDLFVLALSPTVSHHIFATLVDYLYQGRVVLYTQALASNGPTNASDHLNAWLLAEDFGMEGAQNAIMDCLRLKISLSTFQCTTSSKSANMAAKLVKAAQSRELVLQRSSPPYEFLVDQMAQDLLTTSNLFSYLQVRSLDDTVRDITVRGGNMASDILTRFILMKLKNSEARILESAKASGCMYHIHTPGNKWRNCSKSQNYGFEAAVNGAVFGSSNASGNRPDRIPLNGGFPNRGHLLTSFQPSTRPIAPSSKLFTNQNAAKCTEVGLFGNPTHIKPGSSSAPVASTSAKKRNYKPGPPLFTESDKRSSLFGGVNGPIPPPVYAPNKFVTTTMFSVLKPRQEKKRDGTFSVHQSVTLQIPFTRCSFEELRLTDYLLGLGPSNHGICFSAGNAALAKRNGITFTRKC